MRSRAAPTPKPRIDPGIIDERDVVGTQADRPNCIRVVTSILDAAILNHYVFVCPSKLIPSAQVPSQTILETLIFLETLAPAAVGAM